MDEPHVATYEVGPEGLRFLGRHPSLAAAAADLPQGAYTTLRTYGRRGVVRFAQHLRRLEESVALQGHPGAIDQEAARRAVAAALDAHEPGELRVRLVFSPPRLFLAIEPFSPLPAHVYEEGALCVTVDVHRDNPHAKDTRFIGAAQGAYDRLPPGVEEGLLVAEDGSVLEGLSSNFFAVLDGTLRTEEERALRGVTRSLVLEVAAASMPVVRTALHRDELPRAAEAFLTSVSREVLPVVRIDGRAVGDGRVGPRTRRVMADFAALVRLETKELR